MAGPERRDLPRVVAVLGPTAAGKSALGLAIAEAFDGEILACDSMQVYRGMDIGTGKPGAAERRARPHHLIDLVDPGDTFHAAAWAERARAAIVEVKRRGRLPVVVGGSGLYFRALVKGLFDAPPADPEIRARHQAEAASGGTAALHRRLEQIDPETAAGIRCGDLVRISRALEVWEQTGVPVSELRRRARSPAPLEAFSVSVDAPLAELRARIERRVDAMMAAGFLGEVQRLHAAGFAGTRPLAGLGYRQLGLHLTEALALAEAVAAAKRATAGYARRQRVWFRSEAAALRVDARAPDLVPATLGALAAWLAQR